MKGKRRHQRFIRRLEVECSVNDQTSRGISSNFSLGGLFMRTNHPFTPGTVVDLVIHLPDGSRSVAKGIVKMALKTPLASLKNGMGIELVEKDEGFVNFVRTLSPDACEEKVADTYNGRRETPLPASATLPADDDVFSIITCSQCGIRNKVRRSRSSKGVRCGRCGTPFPAT